MLTDDELEAIEARSNAATPGPWIWPSGDDGMHSEPAWRTYREWVDGGCVMDKWTFSDAIITTDGGYYGPPEPDQSFIAHAREDVPRLVAEVRRLRSATERRGAKSAGPSKALDTTKKIV